MRPLALRISSCNEPQTAGSDMFDKFSNGDATSKDDCDGEDSTKKLKLNLDKPLKDDVLDQVFIQRGRVSFEFQGVSYCEVSAV